ncbi:glycoside hydrolase family 61 protein [Apodospora peruviana]|uniref:lytic cellulose monooxygenase (C4-dehydrogenating) n=1 Tax=Apodospora peruviana TaxID=516989 RepID=A0AAE0MD42_9PEZI|nr:glycoside hydrolase family 61 protein [Apodospora peruviana]
MARTTAGIIASLAAGASLVAAHGHVSNIIVNGVYYRNYDPTTDAYNPTPPKVIGWTASNLDNGFVSPDAFGGPDIICHRDATPGGGHATVAAGSKISIQWTPEWPESHHGPVIDYLAACNGPCETVDKTTLKFFKIDSSGYINGSVPGYWASDALVTNGNSWLVQIPADLKAGNYVLRHEIIALHGAGSANGAQAYPQCFNLQVTGSGSNVPAGVAGTSLYKATDAGILFSLYSSPIVYPMPGPALIAGASSSILQSKSVATVTSSATVPGSGSGTTVVTTTTAAVVTTTTTSSVKTTTTLSTSTTAAPATTAAPTGSAQTKWGQCGGSGWSGATACVAGSSCSTINPYYAQCV